MQIIDWEIIHKKIKGKISKEENDELQNWLEQSERHQEYYNKAVRFYQNDQEEQPQKQVDLFMSRLDQKRKRRLFDQLMRYAAVIVLPLLCGIGVWIYSEMEIKEFLAECEIQQEQIPGVKNQAVLITSNGASYNLETNKVKDITDGTGVTIKRSGKTGLKYEKSASNGEQKLAYNVLKTAKGGEYKVELSDGTIAHLNCDSELRYPVNFTGKERRVELKGEGFFEVTKNGKPFIVDVQKLAIKVMGTSFNVMAYADENRIETTLVSGKVSVESGEESVILNPGEQANFTNNELKVETVDVNLYTSWINGYFRFENQRLEDLMRNISRWYDVKVFYNNEQLKDKKLTGKLYRFDQFHVLSGMIEKISGVKIEQSNKTILIQEIE